MPVTAEHIGKRILFTQGENDAVRQTCVLRFSPNGKFADCQGHGAMDEWMSWVPVDSLNVVEVLGPWNQAEGDIVSERRRKMMEVFECP